MKRRDFLKALGVGAAGLSTTRLGAALAGLPKGALAPARADGRDRLAHAVARLTFGVTPDLYAEARRLGADGFIAQQLTPSAIDDSAFAAEFTAWNDILTMDAGALLERYDGGQRGQVVGALTAGTIARQAGSARQLHEQMVYFFSNHFHIFTGKGPITLYLKVVDDREAMRPNAMGSFRQILGASAQSPAMLIYLDNARSDRRAPNENYARELLELHTLGVNGGYTEDDVKAVARAFTGWSLRARRETRPFEFAFRATFHDRDEKSVLGTRLTANGQGEGEQVLDMLAAHPSTARFVSTKLARRFVSDAPSPALVDRLAARFLASNGQMTEVLAELFASDDFWNAPPKLKLPGEFLVSVLRGLSFTIANPTRFSRTLYGALETMGHVPFQWPAPNGYPDVAGAWQDGLIARWNIALAAVSGEVNGAAMDVDRLLRLLDDNGVPLEVPGALTFFGGYLLGRPLTADESGIVLRFAEESGGSPDAQIASGLALILASPAFQYR